MKERIDRWEKMVDAGDSDAMAYLKEISAQAKEEGKVEEMNAAADYLMSSASRRMDRVQSEMAEYTVLEQMGSLAEVINLAFIARHYFGKTRQWLYQRIKGLNVNGKPASFTSDEKIIFRNALDDIGLQISAFTGRI